jgi:hypothetical protein
LQSKIWKINGNGTKNNIYKEVRNDGQRAVNRDMVIALDFAEQIIKNPDLLDEIPEGSVTTFPDGENVKSEITSDKELQRKYVKVKRSFEVL